MSEPRAWRPTFPEHCACALLWRINPAAARRFERERRDAVRKPALQEDISRFRNRTAHPGSALAGVQAVFDSRELAPAQRKPELTALCEVMAARRPRVVLEIGGKCGGTLAAWTLVAAADACIISVDLEYTRARMSALPALARGSQQVVCLAGDSQSAVMRRRVDRALAGRPIDFLYIDGDHRWDGVRSDYRNYQGLVAPAGCIALHDIVEDYRTLYGRATLPDTGDVPRFWRSLLACRPGDVREFVEDREQDGFGIGLLWGSWPEDVPGPP